MWGRSCWSCKLENYLGGKFKYFPPFIFSMETLKICEECKKEFKYIRTGKPRKFCSGKCRQRNRDIKYRTLIRQMLELNKKGKCCSFCGYNEHPEILQFHHKENKEIEIQEIIKHRYKHEEFEEETKKCILLCPNCHFLFHYQERHTK
jgi:hypothetical protein